MHFIKKCFTEYDRAFLMRLEDVGIYGDSARQFLSETTSGILYVFKNTSYEKTISILLSDNPGQLLESINIEVMAKKMAMTSGRVSLGLEAIAPIMTQVYKLNCNEIVEAIASSWSADNEDISLFEKR